MRRLAVDGATAAGMALAQVALGGLILAGPSRGGPDSSTDFLAFACIGHGTVLLLLGLLTVRGALLQWVLPPWRGNIFAPVLLMVTLFFLLGMMASATSEPRALSVPLGLLGPGLALVVLGLALHLNSGLPPRPPKGGFGPPPPVVPPYDRTPYQQVPWQRPDQWQGPPPRG